MAYFKIGNFDLSQYVSGLKVSKAANYTSQTNAAGNTVVDYINTKRTFEVSFIAIDNNAMRTIQNLMDWFQMNITFRNPQTGEEEQVLCILPSNEVEYYTIQADKVLYKAFNLTFIEL